MRDDTNALSLMRLPEDLAQLMSPMVPALLLTMVNFPVLFGGTVARFIGLALLVATVRLPARAPAAPGHFMSSVTKGIRIYPATLGLVLRPWPAFDPAEVDHTHADLPPDHSHLRDHPKARHRHALVINDLRRRWPAH